MSDVVKRDFVYQECPLLFSWLGGANSSWRTLNVGGREGKAKGLISRVER